MEKRSITPFIIRGIVLIILGIIIMFYDENSIKALGVVPGLIVTMIGLAQLGFAYFARKNLAHWQWYLAGGIVIAIIGIILMLNPEITFKIIIVAFGVWFIFQAVQDISASSFWKKMDHPNWWMLALNGVLEAAIGLLFVFNPLKGAMVVTTLIGLGMLLSGILAIIVGMMLRKRNEIIDQMNN